MTNEATRLAACPFCGESAASNCFIVGMSAGAVLASGQGLRVAMCAAIVLGVVNLLLYLEKPHD